MPKVEYEVLRQKIETNYRADLAALERVRGLLDEDPQEVSEPLAKRRGRPKKLSLSEAMKASWARRRKENDDGEKPLSKKEFQKFLVAEPNGERS